VVERVVEVEDDVDAIRERLRNEIEARMKQDLSEEAMAAAREVGRKGSLGFTSKVMGRVANCTRLHAGRPGVRSRVGEGAQRLHHSCDCQPSLWWACLGNMPSQCIEQGAEKYSSSG
jgi:hypothetical protein